MKNNESSDVQSSARLIPGGRGNRADVLRAHKRRRLRSAPLVALFLAIALSHSAWTADGTWTTNANGNWGTNANWAADIVADGAGSLADFSKVDITANRTVTLDASRTSGRLIFADASWSDAANYAYTLSGAGTLTLDNTGGTGGNPPTITTLNGTHIISAVVAGVNGLNLVNPWLNYDSVRTTTSASGGLTMSETAGSSYFATNNTLSGAITVNGGAMRFWPSGKFGNATALTVAGNSLVRNGDLAPANNIGTNRVGDGTAPLTLGGASGAGELQMGFATAGNTHAQTFASLTVGAGQNLVRTFNTAAGTLNLTFTGTAGGAGYVRNTNGLVNVVSASGFNPQFANAPTAAGGSSVAGTAAGGDEILIGAILGGSDFIKAASGTLGAATYVTTLTADKNVNVTGALSTSGNLSINSLRLGDTTKRTVTIGASDTLTLAGGGILLPSSMTTDNINHTLTGGSLTSGQGDLWIYAASGSQATRTGNVNGNPRVAIYAATIASKITGNLSLTVGGNSFSQVLLSGANDYTGGTYLENGLIAVNADSGLGATSGAVTAVSGVNNIKPTAAITFNASRNFVINSGAQLGISGGNSATIPGQVSGGGQLQIGFVGSGGQLLILTGNNSGFTGQYLVNSYLRADEGTGLSTNANLMFTGRDLSNSGVLETSGTFTRSLGSGAGQVQWQNSSGYAGGGFAAVGGALTVNIGGNATPDTLIWGSGYFIPAGGALNFGDGSSTADVTFQNPIALNGAQRPIDVAAAGTTKATMSGALSGNASSGIIKYYAGTLVLTGNNTYQGPTVVSAGTLQIGDGTTDGSIASSSGITNNAALVFNLVGGQSYGGDMVGTGSLTKDGGGTLALGGSNTCSGVTTISGGVLQFGKTASLYNGATASWTTGKISVASGATLGINVGGAGEFSAGEVTTLLTNLGGLGGAVNNNGLRSGSRIAFDTTGAAGGNFTVADRIANSTGTGGGAISVAKLGAGTLTLTGANAYTGPTTVSAGTLQIGAGGGVGAPGAGAITNHATLAHNRSDAVTMANAISGSGAFRKLGGGTLSLTGVLTYGGATTVEDGTLLIQNPDNSGLGLITVDATVSSATLGGTGAVGAVTVPDGILAPGNSVGTLTVGGNLVLSDDTFSILGFQLGDPGVAGSSDYIAGVQGLTLNGVLDVAPAGAYDFLTAADGDEWKLIGYTTLTADNGLTLGSMPGLSGSLTFEVSLHDSGVYLTVVPEPGTAGLVGLFAAAFALRRRLRG